MMYKIRKKMIVFSIVAIMVITTMGLPGMAQAEDWDSRDASAAMIADFVLVRPLGILAIATGSVFFVVSSPFSALGGNINEALNDLIVKPAKFTFVRPLGHF